jgi:hypothetical protein
VALSPNLSPFRQGLGKTVTCALLSVRCKPRCVICLVFGSGFPYKLDQSSIYSINLAVLLLTFKKKLSADTKHYFYDVLDNNNLFSTIRLRQIIRSPCGRENWSKPAVLSLLEISPLSRFCSYYGDRIKVSEAALEEKDPWHRGGTPHAPVRSLSSVRPSFPRLLPRAVGWTLEELRPWRLARRRQSGSCPSPRRRVLLRVPDSFFKTAVGWPSVGSEIRPRRRTSEVAGGYHMPFPETATLRSSRSPASAPSPP